MVPCLECLKKCLKCLKPLGLAAAARAPPIDASSIASDAAAGGGALILVMSENGSVQKWVPSPRIWREMAFSLDYELGRPHLEKAKNRFSIEEVPSSEKQGNCLVTRLGRPHLFSREQEREIRAFLDPPGDPPKMGAM